MADFTQFQFLSPYWLLLILPVLILLVWFYHRSKNDSNWQQVIEPELLSHLLQEQPQQQRRWPFGLSLTAALIAIIALANPVWEKKPQSVFQTPKALVLVLDLSASMFAADIKPSRLVQARLKVQDILNREKEGLTGLVVFAGDAFSVTPLTRDNETISSQLRVLEPPIMPAQGSRVDLGLAKAGELLAQAGINTGDILLIADGYDSAQAVLETKKLHQAGHRISVMGIGTPEGAPIPDLQGDVFRDTTGVPVLARLDEEKFRQLAKTGGGRYSRIQLDDTDIEYLLSQPALNIEQDMQASLIEQNQWKQNGPYLTLLLLPLAAMAFRRGWLMSLLAISLLVPMPENAMANQAATFWDDLWQTREQRAAKALQQQRHEDALNLSKDPAVLGSALYRQNNYAEALEKFAQVEGADADYNRGNALARLGKYEEAIKAYDEALQQQPGMQDAIDNKAAVEALLNQQGNDDKQQDEQENQDKQNQQEQQQQQEQDEQQEQQEQQNQQEQQQDSQQQSADQQQEQEQSNAAEQQQQQAGQQEQNENEDGSEGDQQQDQQSAENNNQQSPDNQFAEAAESMEQEDKQESPRPDPEQQQRPQDQQPQADEKNDATAQAEQQAQQLDSEEQQAAEQWLRRIPDDPGGLLKRKFLYQYQQRNRKPSSRQPW